ncbi:MAG: CoA transferase [Burkholderiales bacterium]|nr:CoA transferase [Burkholderiales bacterium]
MSGPAAPLEGVRVVDLTTVLMGPFATQTLAEFGAEVIKVEPPEGDLIRGIGPMRSPGMGAIFMNANRGKKSVVLDLKADAGRDAMRRLLATADVLVYNVRPQAMARLGLDFDAVRAIAPRLLYVGLFGFARGGPYDGRPAYDDIIQGAAGLPWLSLAAGSERPRYAPLAIADRVTGMAAVSHILAGLRQRDRDGRGRAIDVTMFETMARLVLADHLQGESFVPALGAVGYPRHLARDRRPYATRDGWLCAMIYSARQWRDFFAATGRGTEWAADPALETIEGRTQQVDRLYGIVDAELGARDTREALALLESIDVPAIRMHSIDEMLTDPQLLATGFLGTAEHPTEGTLRTIGTGATWHEGGLPAPGPAPRLGEHTDEVLRSLSGVG